MLEMSKLWDSQNSDTKTHPFFSSHCHTALCAGPPSFWILSCLNTLKCDIMNATIPFHKNISYIVIGSDSVGRLLVAFVNVIYEGEGIGHHDTGADEDQELHVDVVMSCVLAMRRSESL